MLFSAAERTLSATVADKLVKLRDWWERSGDAVEGMDGQERRARRVRSTERILVWMFEGWMCDGAVN